MKYRFEVGITFLILMFVSIGLLIGLAVGIPAPVFDVSIKAPAAPDREKVFGDYLDGFTEGMKMGIPVGQLKEFNLLTPRYNQAMKNAYRPYCVGCTFADDTVTGEYINGTAAFGSTTVTSTKGTRLRIHQQWINGQWSTFIEALPSWEDIFNGVQ